MKKWLVYSAIIGFFLSFNSWSTIYTGVISFIFAFIFTLFNLWLFQLFLRIFGEYYGLYLELDRFTIKKEVKKFSHKIKEIIVSEKSIPIDYLITLFFGIATSGFVFPVLLSIKSSVIESKRIGKTKNYDLTFKERNSVIIYSIISMWILFSIIKNLLFLSPIIQAYVSFTFHFLTMFTWSCITPFNLFLSYIVDKMGYEFTNISIGDILLISATPYYKAVIFSLMVLPILGILLDPFSLLIIEAIIFSIVWSREKFKRAFSS